jgi:arylsulfatase A
LSGRRSFLRTAASACLGPLADPFRAAAGGRPPSILLILADDLGYEALGSNGGQSFRTPRLDGLAAAGMRFEHCYATPLCSPSRVQLMTGRYGFRNYRGWGILDPAERTFAHVLRDAGYATCVSGKWQLCRFDRPGEADQPSRAGFDASCLWTWTYRGTQPSRYWNPSIWQNGELLAGTEGKYGEDVHRDYLLDFIRRNRDRPFFAYYPMNLVHGPHDPTPDGLRRNPRARAKDRANYPDMVEYLDRTVGRILDELEGLGLRDDTLVLFTADNGTARGLTSRLDGRDVPGGKGTMADTGIHVPLLAAWPGRIPAGSVCRELVDFSDFLPTLAEAAGASLPRGVAIDGRSFLPLALGRRGHPRDWVYIHWHDGDEEGRLGSLHRAIRSRRWKLHGNGRLFDLEADPLERRPYARGTETAEAASAREALERALTRLR